MYNIRSGAWCYWVQKKRLWWYRDYKRFKTLEEALEFLEEEGRMIYTYVWRGKHKIWLRIFRKEEYTLIYTVQAKFIIPWWIDIEYFDSYEDAKKYVISKQKQNAK